MGSFYVTTPIYYVNGQPHLGHAYTTMVADALARYYRQRGDEVFFMTGTDEHGLKVQREAEKRDMTPQQLADLNSAKFKATFDKLGLTYDRYIRTTEDAHKAVVTEIYKRMVANDDIYLSKYEGWYAAADEAFYDESEIEDGRSIETGAAVEWVEEESYFFRLSKYQEPLLEWYKSDPNCIRPESRYNEVSSFVASGLKDLSISRTTFDWGIELPDNPEHVMYVWVDALTNYITGVGAFTDEERYNKFWPADLHLLGKDILRFHAVYWPAFLLSAGLDLPKQLFVHGWWLIEGKKMSKRDGNWLDPNKLVEQYPLDVLRYYLLREIPFGNDGNFAQARLCERNNAELADNLGNLVNRTTKMLGSFLGGVTPAVSLAEEDQPLVDAATGTWEQVQAAIERRELHLALELILKFSTELNQYIQRNQPWKLAKQEDAKPRLEQVLYNAVEGIRWVAVMLSPFLPDTSARILGAFGVESSTFDTLTWGALPAGQTITSPPVLFDKLEAPGTKEEAKKNDKQSKKQKKQKQNDGGAKKEESGIIKFDQFLKVEMRVGLVESAQRVDGSDKLLLLQVNVGEEKPRQVVAGIGKAYAPEQLVGNRYAVVTNLKPAKIFKIRSEAMMLAADTEDGGLELATFTGAVAPGTRIG